MSYEDHTYRNITIGITLAVGLLAAFFVVCASPPVTAASFDDLFSTFGMPNIFHIYKINTTCELAYFLVNGPPPKANIMQKISSIDEFKKNFPDEYNRLTNLVSANQFTQFISSDNILQSSSMRDLSGQLKDIVANIIVKGYSINPENKRAIITLMDSELNYTALDDAVKKGGCEMEMKQKYENWNTS